MPHPGVIILSGADTNRDEQADSGLLRYPPITPDLFGFGFGLGTFGTGTFGV